MKKLDGDEAREGPIMRYLTMVQINLDGGEVEYSISGIISGIRRYLEVAIDPAGGSSRYQRGHRYYQPSNFHKNRSKNRRWLFCMNRGFFVVVQGVKAISTVTKSVTLNFSSFAQTKDDATLPGGRRAERAALTGYLLTNENASHFVTRGSSTAEVAPAESAKFTYLLT